MRLIIFDIDGTIIDSVKTDDECFIKTFKDLHNIDLSANNWSDFKNVTDWGLTNEIFQLHFDRKPTELEINKIKSHFFDLLVERHQEFVEIPNSLKFIEYLHSLNNYTIAFATGGWKETAILKTKSIGLDLNSFVLKSSNDNFKRAEIIKLAVQEALKSKSLKRFQSVTYIGDGVWDLKVCLQLNLQFIGIDFKKNEKLKKAGADIIFTDFIETQKIMECLNNGMSLNTHIDEH